MQTRHTFVKTLKIISVFAVVLACNLAATLKAQNLYVGSGNGSGIIGEYGLDGSTVNASLISGLSYPGAMTISGNDLFFVNTGGSSICEYTTSGSTVNS